ncbi:MAG: DUF1206 domain-containing protein [Actinobacteria bacterium]|nr:DUF1206 domain-containing protein [Actinomycetota bacterium]
MKDTGIPEAARSAHTASQRAANSTWVDRLARFGLVAKGFSYGLVGVLAGALAVAGAGKATDREGALEVLADEGYGKLLLVALALGFAAYGLWRLIQAIFDRDDEGSGAKGIAKRIGYLGRAILYGGLTYVTLALLDGAGDKATQTGQTRNATARVFDWPAGRWLVGLAGLILIGVGVFNAYRAFTQKFEDNWKTGEMTEAERRWGPRLSSLGLLARFVVFSLIGGFFVKAAYEYDAQEAIGLDGALRKLAQASYGPVLLGIVAAGLLCYALFCFVEARNRRV